MCITKMKFQFLCSSLACLAWPLLPTSSLVVWWVLAYRTEALHSPLGTLLTVLLAGMREYMFLHMCVGGMGVGGWHTKLMLYIDLNQ